MLTDLIPAPYRLALELLTAAAVLGGIFYLGHRGGVEAERVVMQAKLDELQHRWDSEKLTLQQAAIKAQQDAQAETARRIAAAKDQDHEDLTRAERRADDAVAVAAGDRGLQQRFAAVAAAGCGRPAGDPAAASVGQAASSSGDLLADVQRRMGEAAATVVRFADESADAASSCAARYDSLSAAAH